MQFKRLNVITSRSGAEFRHAKCVVIPGRETQLNFIYQTPMTYFANKVTRTSNRQRSIIAIVPTSGAMLVDALSGYFRNVVCHAGSGRPTSIQASAVSAAMASVASIGALRKAEFSEVLEDQRQIWRDSL